MLMVVQREMRAGSRRWLLYWSRFIAGGVAIWIMAMNATTISMTGGGRHAFGIAITIAFAACLLEGVRRAGSSIADEKTEGTYDLLLSTRLTGRELLYGKFIVVFLSSLQLALAVSPIIAIPLLMGGVTGSEMFHAPIALLHTLSLSIAIGIVFSSILSTSTGAMLITIMTLIVGAVASAFIFTAGRAFPNDPLSFFLPITPILSWPSNQNRLPFWTSLILWQGIAFLLLRHRGQRLAADWLREQDEAARYTPVFKESMEPAGKPNDRNRFFAPAWFKGHPIEWLSLREMGMHWGRKVLVGIALVTAFDIYISDQLGLAIAVVVGGLFAIGISIGSSRTFAILRRAGLFEVLLTTPLQEDEIIRAHRAALRTAFQWPALIVTAGVIALLINLELKDQSSNLLFGLYLVAGFLLMLCSAPYIGMWFGLTSKTPARAAFGTVLTVLVAPRLAFCYLGDAILFALGYPLARDAVRRAFRKIREGA